MTFILALTGQSGAGKDTLANMLTSKPYGYTRKAFGDSLRIMTKKVFGELRTDGDERDTDYCEHGSFKDAMLVVGASATLSGPLCFCKIFAKQFDAFEGPCVVTDVRKPVELKTLQELSDKHDMPLYFVEVVRPGQPPSDKRLDNLLTSDSTRCSKLYNELQIDAWSQQCDLINPHGVIANDGGPEAMLVKLSAIMELAVPYSKRNLVAV